MQRYTKPLLEKIERKEFNPTAIFRIASPLMMGPRDTTFSKTNARNAPR